MSESILRLVVLLWISWWTALSIWQIGRGELWWSISDVVMLVIGVWCYIESIIRSVRRSITSTHQQETGGL